MPEVELEIWNAPRRPRGITVASKAESDRWPEMWQVWICTDPKDEDVEQRTWGLKVETRENAEYVKRALNARYPTLLVSVWQVHLIDRL